jgi:DNA modification methylase
VKTASDTDLRLGDCREVLGTLADNSVDLTVTSPPYDNLRTYNGFTFDFEGIARELFGSGTTGKMARQHGRKFVGIEISPEYLAIARKRIEDATADLFAAA